METTKIKLEKYKASKLFGASITELIVKDNNSYGEIIVKNIIGQEKKFYLEASIGHSSSIHDYSADYLLCELQDDEDINVSKY